MHYCPVVTQNGGIDESDTKILLRLTKIYLQHCISNLHLDQLYIEVNANFFRYFF